jgi:hypothetical protein
MKLRLITKNQLLSKPVFQEPLVEIQAEALTKIVILGIQRLQQLQPKSFYAKTFT